MRVLFAAIAVLSLNTATAQTPGGGAVSGSVASNLPTPVGNAVVAATRLRPAPYVRITTTTDAKGSFAFANLPAGDYELCARATSLTVDSCLWSPPPLHNTVTIAAGKAITGVQIRTRKSATVKVRVNDSTKALQPVAGKPAPHVIVGVSSPHGRFQFGRIVSKDANGYDYEVPAATDIPLKLHVSSPHVELADPNNKAAPADGIRIPVQQASTAVQSLSMIVVNVTGPKIR